MVPPVVSSSICLTKIIKLELPDTFTYLILQITCVQAVNNFGIDLMADA